MNLHGTVRGAITSVNPDITAQFLASQGHTTDDAGNQTPVFAAGVPVRIQVQPLSRGDLKHLDNLNIQGVFRTVFMYGNSQGVVRPNQQGGDLLTFPQFAGQASATWLVVSVDGPWNVEQGGWTKVLVCLQEDIPQNIIGPSP
jgi:hypothetical protein